jgi:hypothetical protein
MGQRSRREDRLHRRDVSRQILSGSNATIRLGTNAAGCGRYAIDTGKKRAAHRGRTALLRPTTGVGNSCRRQRKLSRICAARAAQLWSCSGFEHAPSGPFRHSCGTLLFRASNPSQAACGRYFKAVLDLCNRRGQRCGLPASCPLIVTNESQKNPASKTFHARFGGMWGQQQWPRNGWRAPPRGAAR